MTKEKQIEKFMKELEELWKMYPDQRFGQLMFNYTRFGTRTEEIGVIRDIFHYQDEDILKDIKLTKELVE